MTGLKYCYKINEKNKYLRVYTYFSTLTPRAEQHYISLLFRNKHFYTLRPRAEQTKTIFVQSRK